MFDLISCHLRATGAFSFEGKPGRLSPVACLVGRKMLRQAVPGRFSRFFFEKIARTVEVADLASVPARQSVDGVLGFCIAATYCPARS
jgi:hypothetical protein